MYFKNIEYLLVCAVETLNSTNKKLSIKTYQFLFN